MLHIPVFVISLPESKERRIFMKKQLEKLGQSFEFSSGFYGNSKEVEMVYNSDLAIKENGRLLMQGERGCAYAHRHVYEQMIKQDISMALVLEDDVFVTRELLCAVQSVVELPKGAWDWVSFAYYYVGYRNIIRWFIASYETVRREPSMLAYTLVKVPYILTLYTFEGIRDLIARVFPFYRGPKRFYRPLYNAGCYLITKEGIHKLHDLYHPMRFTADRLPNQGRVKRGLKMGGYVPQVTIQDFSFESVNGAFSNF